MRSSSVFLPTPGIRCKSVFFISLPSFLLAPVQPGQRVGEICYALDGEVLQRIPIEAEYKIAARPVAGFAERFREYIGLLLRGLLC